MSYFLPFFTVIVSFILTYFFKPNNQKAVKIFLSFSGGFLLGITLFEFLPELYGASHHGHDHPHLDHRTVGLWIAGGILFQIFLEIFSHGAEHGHIHHASQSERFPIMFFLSLFIHSFFEGFPLHHTDGILLGVIIHKFPVAIIVSSFLLQSNFSKNKIALFILLFAFSTPLGVWVSSNFEGIMKYYTHISALVVGVFLHVSTTILFESSEGHRYNIAKITAIISALVMAYFW